VAIALLAVVVIGCSGLYAIWNKTQVEKETPVAAAPVEVSTAPQPKALESQPAPPIVEPGTIQVDLSATETTWVSLSSAGKTVFSGVLDPAQTKNFAVSEQAKLLTGNAAGLDVRWNGKPIGPIGSRGQVRTVLLGADHYEILPPRGM
jgi:cytoskeleton protein RodZ